MDSNVFLNRALLDNVGVYEVPVWNMDIHDAFHNGGVHRFARVEHHGDLLGGGVDTPAPALGAGSLDSSAP